MRQEQHLTGSPEFPIVAVQNVKRCLLCWCYRNPGLLTRSWPVRSRLQGAVGARSPPGGEHQGQTSGPLFVREDPAHGNGYHEHHRDDEDRARPSQAQHCCEQAAAHGCGGHGAALHQSPPRPRRNRQARQGTAHTSRLTTSSARRCQEPRQPAGPAATPATPRRNPPARARAATAPHHEEPSHWTQRQRWRRGGLSR